MASLKLEEAFMKDSEEMYSRKGRFWISQGWFQRNASALLTVFRDLLVVRCECHWYRQQFEYTVIGHDLPQIPAGKAPPDYECWVRMNEMCEIEEYKFLPAPIPDNPTLYQIAEDNDWQPLSRRY